MVKIKSNSIILKDEEKFQILSDIITYYDGGEKRIHQNEFFWYGTIYDKLVSFPEIRLMNLHKVILKRKADGKTQDQEP
jgi:hypothetical protein